MNMDHSQDLDLAIDYDSVVDTDTRDTDFDSGADSDVTLPWGRSIQV